MLGVYQSMYPKIGFLSMALDFMTPINEMSRKEEIPGNSRILVFVIEI